MIRDKRWWRERIPDMGDEQVNVSPETAVRRQTPLGSTVGISESTTRPKNRVKKKKLNQREPLPIQVRRFKTAPGDDSRPEDASTITGRMRVAAHGARDFGLPTLCSSTHGRMISLENK